MVSKLAEEVNNSNEKTIKKRKPKNTQKQDQKTP